MRLRHFWSIFNPNAARNPDFFGSGSPQSAKSMKRILSDPKFLNKFRQNFGKRFTHWPTKNLFRPPPVLTKKWKNFGKIRRKSEKKVPHIASAAEKGKRGLRNDRAGWTRSLPRPSTSLEQSHFSLNFFWRPNISFAKFLFLFAGLLRNFFSFFSLSGH